MPPKGDQSACKFYVSCRDSSVGLTVFYLSMCVPPSQHKAKIIFPISLSTELSAEAQAALREFEERERQLKQGRYGSRRGGRRGGSVMCHGMGDQRRDNNDRGRMKDHRPALLPNQPSMVPFNP